MAFLSILSSFLSAAVLLVAAVPYDRAHDCNLLFAKNGTISKAEYDPSFQHCAIDADAPTTVAGINTHIYHFNEDQGWVDDEIHEILLTAAREAMTEAITVYSAIATIPEVYLFLVRESWNKLDQADTWIAVPGEPCRVRLMWDSMRAKPLATNKQTIAHELFHCVQFQQFGPEAMLKSGITAHDWWIEGGADFFSAIVYPNVNDEWNWSQWYRPSQPLWKHSYAASVFFEWLYNNPDGGTSASALWEWMKTFSVNWDWLSEASRVAALPQMADWFPSFIEAYEGKGIPDTDGISVVPRYYPMPTHRFTTSISKNSHSSQHAIKVVSFTGDLSATELKEGQTLSLSYMSQSDKLKVKYKLDLGNAYEDLWQEFKKGDEIALKLPCGQGGILQLLTTNVATEDQSITVTIARKEKEKCSCKSKDGPPFSEETIATRKRYIGGDSRIQPSLHLTAINAADIDPNTGEGVPPEGPDFTGGETQGASLGHNGSNIDEEEEEECEEETELSKCLVGSWSLSLESMEELMRQALVIPDVPEVQISNIDITGSSVLTIGDAWIGNWTYDALTVAFDVNTLDLGAQYTKTALNGDLSFALLDLSNTTAEDGVITKRQQTGREQGGFTMRTIAASGTVVSYSPLIGEINWPMDASYVPPDLVLKYVCTGRTLALTGFQGGVAASGWVYGFDRI